MVLEGPKATCSFLCFHCCRIPDGHSCSSRRDIVRLRHLPPAPSRGGRGQKSSACTGCVSVGCAYHRAVESRAQRPHTATCRNSGPSRSHCPSPGSAPRVPAGTLKWGSDEEALHALFQLLCCSPSSPFRRGLWEVTLEPLQPLPCKRREGPLLPVLPRLGVEEPHCVVHNRPGL